MNIFIKYILISAFSFVISVCYSQEIPVYDFEKLKPLLYKQNDTVYLVNFWSTWCVPCVKEMPVLQKIESKYSNKKFKILLVSLDFPNHIENKVVPFLKKYNIKSKVILIDDPDFNSWIDKVYKSWNGSIPATLIYDKTKRDFYEKSFVFEELDKIINDKINKL